jgi:hypothetical protein
MISLKTHIEALRESDDRRYTEVQEERSKALKIKETADLTALELARQIQTYKDEKANELRSQIERERGNYASRNDIQALREYFDIQHKAVIEFMASVNASNKAKQLTFGQIMQILSVLVALGTVIALVIIH